MFDDLKIYAKENKVPIIRDECLSFLLENIKKYNIKRILEIGTAIGYSALCMASLDAFVTSIERNDLMYQKACENINKYSRSDSITLEFADALEYETDKMFDMLFIDAAKAQNIKFVERYKKNLVKGGIIIVDNLAFHGLVGSNENMSKNLKNLTRKIQEFKDWITLNPEFETEIFDSIGDGVSISIKK